MSDPSPAVIGELIRDPRVDDTAGLDRARQSLSSEPLWVRAQRLLPFLQWRVFPGAWTASNATAFIYYVLWGLPFAGVIGAVSAWRSPWLTTQEVARLGTVVIVCVALNILRAEGPGRRQDRRHRGSGGNSGRLDRRADLADQPVGLRVGLIGALARSAGARNREHCLADERGRSASCRKSSAPRTCGQ